MINDRPAGAFIVDGAMLNVKLASVSTPAIMHAIQRGQLQFLSPSPLLAIEPPLISTVPLPHDDDADDDEDTLVSSFNNTPEPLEIL